MEMNVRTKKMPAMRAVLLSGARDPFCETTDISDSPALRERIRFGLPPGGAEWTREGPGRPYIGSGRACKPPARCVQVAGVGLPGIGASALDAGAPALRACHSATASAPRP